MKVKQVKDAKIKPMKPFKTIEEEADFWDTHSVVDDINEGTIIGFHKANKTDTVTVRLEPDDVQWVKREAFKKGVGPSTLMRMWVKQMREQTQNPAR